MEEIRTKIRQLIIDYNKAVDHKNDIYAIDIDMTTQESPEVNYLDNYVIRYDDGSKLTFTTYESMYFYLLGIIDGIKKAKNED